MGEHGRREIRKTANSCGMGVQLPRWSPDGKWVAFMGKQPDRPWRIFVVPAAGGVPKEAAQSDDNQGAPTWSPDGRSLSYGNVLCLAEHTCAIHTIDLASARLRHFPIPRDWPQRVGPRMGATLPR